MNSLLTTAEAAALLGITPQSVRRQINRCRIVAEKRGRDHFISRVEVERYKASRKVGRPATAHPPQLPRGDEWDCLCLFPYGDQLDASTVRSLSLLGAAVVLARRGKTPGIDRWLMLPGDIPQWIQDEIKRLVPDEL